MKMRFYLLLIFFGIWGIGKSQDIHYSMFNMSPLTLNPALTGSFEGTVRIGGIYRDQWSSFLSNQFVTPSFYVDAPLIRGLRKQDWVGVGGMVFSDKAGTSEMRYTGSMLSVAYHMGLSKQGKHLLTLGLQGGSSQRRINLQAPGLKFADELPTQVGGGGLGIGNGMDRQINDNVSFLDFSLGAMLRSRLSDKDQLEIGFSLAHLTQPRYGFAAGGLPGPGGASAEQKRPARTAIHGRLQHRFTDQLYVEPTFLLQSTGGASEFSFQAIGGLKLNDDLTLRAGPGMRFGDALQVIAGADYQDLRVALSYDFTMSKLSQANNGLGGFELAAYYIIKIYKKPKISPAILCPQF